MIRKLRTALRFSRQEWWLLAHAWVLLWWVDVNLRLRAFPKVRAQMARLAEVQATTSADAPSTIRRTQRMVNVAARYHLYPMLCLRRALVLQTMLGRQGIPTQLHLGVEKEQETLKAHAWVEYEGRPLGEPDDVARRYLPLTAAHAVHVGSQQPASSK